MAHLASVGSHAINGVAALHSDLLKETVLRDFYAVSPEKFLQRHQRRHSAALDRAEQPGAGGARHARASATPGCRISSRELVRIEPFAEDAGFRAEWRAVKADNKRRLAALIRQRTGIVVDPDRSSTSR